MKASCRIGFHAVESDVLLHLREYNDIKCGPKQPAWVHMFTYKYV